MNIITLIAVSCDFHCCNYMEPLAMLQRPWRVLHLRTIILCYIHITLMHDLYTLLKKWKTALFSLYFGLLDLSGPFTELSLRYN